ncbi:hypothetical protein Anapl_12265 [Anas platyrhynchos]|uniref:Uncharacterized protein n=1 Tax=Anas platyrhynchos TaxID=8839 RepID=R0LHL4_ANAPL|nr:hypothetical protein Anapl_12265 [Anas platyrhynchos]
MDCTALQREEQRSASTAEQDIIKDRPQLHGRSLTEQVVSAYKNQFFRSKLKPRVRWQSPPWQLPKIASKGVAEDQAESVRKPEATFNAEMRIAEQLFRHSSTGRNTRAARKPFGKAVPPAAADTLQDSLVPTRRDSGKQDGTQAKVSCQSGKMNTQLATPARYEMEQKRQGQQAGARQAQGRPRRGAPGQAAEGSSWGTPLPSAGSSQLSGGPGPWQALDLRGGGQSTASRDASRTEVGVRRCGAASFSLECRTVEYSRLNFTEEMLPPLTGERLTLRLPEV